MQQCVAVDILSPKKHSLFSSTYSILFFYLILVLSSLHLSNLRKIKFVIVKNPLSIFVGYDVYPREYINIARKKKSIT